MEFYLNFYLLLYLFIYKILELESRFSEYLVPSRVFVPYEQDSFFRWNSTGIHRNMIDCCATDVISRRPDIHRRKLAILEINNNGNNISLGQYDESYRISLNDSIYNRMTSIKKGIAMSINYLKSEMNKNSIPDIYALLIPLDDSQFIREKKSLCHCSTFSTFPGKKSDFRPCNSSKSNYTCDMTTIWPPIFGQNRDSVEDNILVLIPDFSYFSTLGDHEGPKNSWFDVLGLENNLEERTKNIKNISLRSTFRPIEFRDKIHQEAVWRGSVEHKRWTPLRRAVSRCHSVGRVNSRGIYISRAQMCKDYQMIITLPGNGAWSWALKFNMVWEFACIEYFDNSGSAPFLSALHFLANCTDKR